MNDYLINPWFIYLIGISEKVQTFLHNIGGAFVFLAIIMFAMLFLFTYLENNKVKHIKKWLLCGGLLFVCGVISTAVSTLIPERGWIVGTAVAATMTEEKAEKTWEKIKDEGGNIVDFTSEMKDSFKTDIIDIIDSINKTNDSQETTSN